MDWSLVLLNFSIDKFRNVFLKIVFAHLPIVIQDLFQYIWKDQA